MDSKAVVVNLNFKYIPQAAVNNDHSFCIMADRMMADSMFSLEKPPYHAGCTGMERCWCENCRKAKLEGLNGSTEDYLYKQITLYLPLSMSRSLDDCFEETMKGIVACKAYRYVVNRTTGYKQIKTYFKKFKGLEDKLAKKFADKINESTRVFDNLEVIKDNLSNCQFVDIRSWNVHQLYMAKNSRWCIAQDELNRQSGEKAKNILYEEQDFKDLVKLVKNSPAFQAVQHNSRKATGMIQRLQRCLVKNDPIL